MLDIARRRPGPALTAGPRAQAVESGLEDRLDIYVRRAFGVEDDDWTQVRAEIAGDSAPLASLDSK